MTFQHMLSSFLQLSSLKVLVPSEQQREQGSFVEVTIKRPSRSQLFAGADQGIRSTPPPVPARRRLPHHPGNMVRSEVTAPEAKRSKDIVDLGEFVTPAAGWICSDMLLIP